MTEEEKEKIKEKIKELIRLLYRDDLSQYGKRNLETYINKLMEETEKVKQLEKENENLKRQLKAEIYGRDMIVSLNSNIRKENKELKDNQLWSEATIEGLKERFIPKEKVDTKIKEYEDMLKTLNKKSDTDRIKAINERIIGYKELLGVGDSPTEYLKCKLEEKKISQAELAKRLGVNKSTITHYITGRIELKNLSAERITEMAMILDVPIDEFIRNIV